MLASGGRCSGNGAAYEVPGDRHIFHLARRLRIADGYHKHFPYSKTWYGVAPK